MTKCNVCLVGVLKPVRSMTFILFCTNCGARTEELGTRKESTSQSDGKATVTKEEP